jgi:hypothetical protein
MSVPGPWGQPLMEHLITYLVLRVRPFSPSLLAFLDFDLGPFTLALI